MSTRRAAALCLLAVPWLMAPEHAAAQIPVSAVQIGQQLPIGFEASGIVWHQVRRQYLVVSDNGSLAAIDRTGTLLATWSLSGDLEDLCVADHNSALVYVANEEPPALIEFDLGSSTVRRVFDLAPHVPTPSGRGIEAVTFVPDVLDPEGGTFLVGSTHDGRVHRFRLPIASSSVSNQVTALGSFAIAPSNELRALHADPIADVVYALFTDPDVVYVVRPNGLAVANHLLPNIVGEQAEGLAMRGCELVVAQDGGRSPSSLWRFDGFDTHSACETLSSNVAAVSVFFGGSQVLELDLGPAAAGWPYIVLGSARIGSPGIVGAPGLVLPLVVDEYFFTTLSTVGSPVYQGFVGVLDGSGRVQASLNVPPGHPVVTSLFGTRLFHAAAVYDPTLGVFVHASNALPLLFAF